ncbi:hypothetical protein D3C73_1516370 [compost metagenome]
MDGMGSGEPSALKANAAEINICLNDTGYRNRGPPFAGILQSFDAVRIQRL